MNSNYATMMDIYWIGRCPRRNQIRADGGEDITWAETVRQGRGDLEISGDDEICIFLHSGVAQCQTMS